MIQYTLFQFIVGIRGSIAVCGEEDGYFPACCARHCVVGREGREKQSPCSYLSASYVSRPFIDLCRSPAGVLFHYTALNYALELKFT